MIAHIKGAVKVLTEKYVVVDTGNIGYKIYATNDTLARLVIDKDTALFTYLVVREDALDLYGFGTLVEQEFFELLISVSGIGPKSALGILNVAAIETLAQAIGTGDTTYLTKVSGIGRKTAEKIVLELRDKMHAHRDKDEKPDGLRVESDIIEALKALGYSQHEARDALKEISSDVSTTNARIKEALKILGKR